MAWRLNTALTNFRAAVDRAYPNRDRTSDGTIGDAAHQASVSDHNPDADGTVDAWDMDVNLRSGDDAAAIEMLKRVFQRHPAARYWIHNRQIAHRDTGWRRERYTGSNPHDQHIHWNSNQATENSTAPWILEVDDMAVGDDIYRLLHDGLRAGPSQTANGGIPIAWIVRKVGEIQVDLAALKAAAAADAGRDAEIRELLLQHQAGQLDAAAVVRRMGELLSADDATQG